MRRKRPFSPNNRDTAILELVYDYRYMSVELLTALLCELPAADRRTGFSLSALRARCQKLRTAKYLTWQFLYDQPSGRGYRTERPAVYSIGPAAITILAERFGMEPAALKSLIKRNKVGSYFLRHALGISKFRVCLTLACQKTWSVAGLAEQKPIQIGAWLQEGLNDSVTVEGKDGRETIPVVPDAVFSLIVGSEGREQTVSHFALEYDRGTMPLSDIARKAKGYWHYLQQGLHRRKYTYAEGAGNLPELKIVEVEWPKITLVNQKKILKSSIKTLQVLFVTTANKIDLGLKQQKPELHALRQHNMAKSIAQITEINPETLRFLFCIEETDFGLHQPAALFTSIWKTINPNLGKRRILSKIG